ncbi:probable class I alpha mannosidase [Rhynchosporium graminicola]|uniref:alpha-1,2-Mannosidase n=1 Tax=Rhynchosporium graminicola TaxID=2792576 RepID=A0A1E1LGB0_9HELO|nr:probable class I alpha mannosidase [Rhynchosporium commune]
MSSFRPKQLSEKAILNIKTYYPRPLAIRPRSRHFLIAILLLCLYLYFPSYSTSSIPSTRLPKGPRPYKIQATFQKESADAKAIRVERQGQVKDAFRHAWKGYNHYAWMHDEVMPVSGKTKDNFVGWAATLVDSLDSLYIMGLQEKFDEALEALKEIDFSKPKADKVPVFEVTIRYLGGLLGAYDVSKHKYPILLQKATQLGDFLSKAFNTENGLPVPYYWWKNETSGVLPGQDNVIIAQIASLSMEFIRLSQVTGNKTYAAQIQVITEQLKTTQDKTALPGMWPLLADCSGPQLSFSNEKFSLGVLADSAFEYLPKTHLLDYRTSDQYLKMYQSALATFSKRLFFRPSLPQNPDILMSGNIETSIDPNVIDGQFQHLACFVGGMVALGSRISISAEELETAAKLTNGCVWGYDNTPSGIMPDFSHIKPCQDPAQCVWEGSGNGFVSVDDPSYQLRPEAIESVFIMYRLTADPIWMEKGWKMFQAVQKHTKTSIANARVVDVMEKWPKHEDSMESYWLAETLKYFYLLFSKPDLVSLDEYVLNTEAHPFRWA